MAWEMTLKKRLGVGQVGQPGTESVLLEDFFEGRPAAASAQSHRMDVVIPPTHHTLEVTATAARSIQPKGPAFLSGWRPCLSFSINSSAVQQEPPTKPVKAATDNGTFGRPLEHSSAGHPCSATRSPNQEWPIFVAAGFTFQLFQLTRRNDFSE